MKLICCLTTTLIYSAVSAVDWNAPWIEREHNPHRYTTERPRVTDEDVQLPTAYESPDFRIEEPPFTLFLPHAHTYEEEHRPYRISPHYKMTYPWTKAQPHEDMQTTACYCTTVYKRLTTLAGCILITTFHILTTAYDCYVEDMQTAACYCTTVYKRLTPLAGCALITTRHILTTATSTHLVLRDRLHYDVLENVLGAWYDNNADTFNSSMYLTPSRIHYHPLWHYPEQVNRSHPFSFTFDLAVWATTYTVYGWYFNSHSATVCWRATSHPRWWGSARPIGYEAVFIIIGYQYMFAYKRKPTPWHKYAIKTWKYTYPCPKTEWGWFICIPAEGAKFGVESGAALHRADKTWKYNGLIAMAAFSMKLRSVDLNLYFTVIDCHPVLEFLYDAYESSLPYVWLDKRFDDTKHYAPTLKSQYYLHKDYRFGEIHEFEVPVD